MTDKKTKALVLTALMAALVFIATYLIRIPNPATGGYSHLGDCMIFLAVIILGRKYGAAAAAIGGGLSDLLAGAAVWIAPTVVIKFIMAFIMGTIISKNPGSAKLQLCGAVTGGIFQIVAYTMVKVVLMGGKVAVMSLPNVTLQTSFGIIIFMVLARLLSGRMAGLVEKEV